VGLAAAVVLAGVAGATAAGPGRLRQQAGALASQRRAAVLDLYALESKVAAAQSRVGALQQLARTLSLEARQLHVQAVATRTTLVVSQRRLAANLRGLYKQGDVSALAVMLGSDSLDDALSRLDSLNAVATQSEQVVTVTTAARSKLTTLRAELGARRSRIAAALSGARRTLDTLSAARAARVSFISTLRTQEQLKSRQIQALEARVQIAEQKSAVLQDAADGPPATTEAAAVTTEAGTTAAVEPAPAPVPPPPPANGRTITVDSTGYSLTGHTATGLPVGWGVVAVDPSVIPLGTKLTIPGYGPAVAADTGGGVRGREIDIWFPTLAQARAWGRRTVSITLH
jgi:3D (Asp-Asp-Asp) domain-containing protein/peptidoglycan hydrolase CwlO-like protein